MKKKIGIVVGTLVGAAVLGLSVYQSSADEVEAKLSHDEVRDLISIEYPGKITEFELEEENGKAVYEIEIEDESREYDLKVDGDTGKVLKDEVKQRETQANQEDSKSTNENNHVKENAISVQEAEYIAVQEFPGKVTEMELDEDDGRLIYEVELIDGDQEAEFDIDAITGEILEFEIDN